MVDRGLVLVEDAELECAHLRAEQLRLALAVTQRLASLVEVTLDSLLELLESFFFGWPAALCVGGGALVLHHRLHQFVDLPLLFLTGIVRLTAEVALTGLLVATADLRDEKGPALAEPLG